MIAVLSSIVLLASFVYFSFRRTLRYLHIFQQEEYDSSRFFAWLFREFAIDRRLSIVIVALSSLALVVGKEWLAWFWQASFVATFLMFAFLEPDPRRAAKKKLALTSRARRILAVSLVVSFVLSMAVIYSLQNWPWLLSVHFIPFTLPLAAFALHPIETKIQHAYWKEAREKLGNINPQVIAITGSFGKTSVKHILGHVLETTSHTLITPGSVNTPMGITRIIRESMGPECENFVVEMGAYGPGSVARLCALTPPSVGIITAIGEAHYERFKDLDTVAQTKFELAQAVLASPKGRVIIHESVLAQAYAEEFVREHRARFYVCGSDPHADLRIVSAMVTTTGVEVEVEWDQQSLRLSAPIYGVQQAGNVALAFAAAMALGVPAENIALSLKRLPQIKHRLEVKRLQDGSINIDDAYNSNPVGFAAALELLPILRPPGARAILITPGMAELGARHDQAHFELGRMASTRVDLVLIVRPERIKAFLTGFSEGGGDATKIHTFESLERANVWLSANRKSGDVVLFENDLPDVYESKLVL